MEKDEKLSDITIHKPKTRGKGASSVFLSTGQDVSSKTPPQLLDFSSSEL